MQGVLVLNASYEPLSVVSLKRAVVLLLKEKAEIVEAAEAVLRAEHITLPLPLVIRLVYYVRLPRRLSLPLTRRTILARDHYTCQYCGAQPGRAELTVDHVVPKSQGGKTVWENVVTACRACNQRKGHLSPAQAGLRLRSEPQRPRYVALAFLSEPAQATVWGKYLRAE